jgi:hypothetical protein
MVVIDVFDYNKYELILNSVVVFACRGSAALMFTHLTHYVHEDALYSSMSHTRIVCACSIETLFGPLPVATGWAFHGPNYSHHEFCKLKYYL